MAELGQCGFSFRRLETVAIGELSGRVDSFNVTELSRQIQSDIDAGDQTFILDCTPLDYVSSAGLRMMLLLARQFQKPKSFVICGLSHDIHEIFKISGFDRILVIKATLDEALEA